MTSEELGVPAIHLRDLRFGWTPKAPLLDISELRIEQGERLFLQGPSGSGKSTLLGLIGGVLLPQAGSISVLGTDISTLGASARDRFRADHVGFIFQQFNLLPFLDVIDNVTLPCKFSPRRAERARAAAASQAAEAHLLLLALGLDPYIVRGRSVRELSVGQQQRVAAARALIGAPEILIVDEPTSALDEDARTAFLTLLIAQCQRYGSTLVFVSHDSSLASLFDRKLQLAQINRTAVALAA
jgi:putative ABC transport system ATP-binding protein